jgi:hypothetical protein
MDPDGNWPGWLEAIGKGIASAFNFVFSSGPNTRVTTGEIVELGPVADDNEFVFEIAAKADLGPQIAIKTPIMNANMDAASAELCSVSFDFLTGEFSNFNYMGDGDGTLVENGASLALMLPVKRGSSNLGIGVEVKQTQTVTDINGLDNGGYLTSGYEAGASLFVGPRTKTAPLSPGTGFSAPVVTPEVNLNSGSNFYGLDIDFGGAFIFGIDFQLTIGKKY